MMLLDLFCGGGGCSAGYVRAGFTVTGVDHVQQPHYLASGVSAFVLGDAVEYARLHGHEYDVIAASPPCQGYSRMARAVETTAPRMITWVRWLLQWIGRPFVIENVEGAPLGGHVVTLCGSMFALRVRRHRLFEFSEDVPLLLTPPCQCRHGVRDGKLIGHRTGGKVAAGRTKPPPATESDRRAAIGVPWMTARTARQAIPPAYTEYVGKHLMTHLRGA